MFKKIFYIFIAGIFVFAITRLSFAMMCGSHEGHSSHQKTVQSDTEHQHMEAPEVSAQTEPQEAVSVGNKICPVSDEKIDEKNKVTYEYEGKIYNFCCKACVKDFKKDPQKYIKKVEEELESRSKEETEDMKTMQEPTSSQGVHEEYHHEGDEGHHHQ